MLILLPLKSLPHHAPRELFRYICMSFPVFSFQPRDTSDPSRVRQLEDELASEKRRRQVTEEENIKLREMARVSFIVKLLSPW